MSKKRRGTEMWHLRPDSGGWWVVDAPGFPNFFVQVHEKQEDLFAFGVFPSGESAGLEFLMHIAPEAEDTGNGWYWQPIRIPDMCPEFDMEDD